ncbi:hypothetical protein P280DRAFT_11748 [Massarina eburnea CBS 473.64]|uniref:Uncharacterized protein n=1 Tax=Massarina eburnea CBS 473.64 TaxID=1395130 RepID=A0A6A6SFA1_9PLEO|nr:hypothetical protein P280DRAFT_11748 [Massarina eburnea CBS 473.64]
MRSPPALALLLRNYSSRLCAVLPSVPCPCRLVVSMLAVGPSAVVVVLGVLFLPTRCVRVAEDAGARLPRQAGSSQR